MTNPPHKSDPILIGFPALTTLKSVKSRPREAGERVPRSPWSRIMLPAKNFHLPPSRTQSVDNPVHFVWFPARLPHFAHNHVCIYPAVSPGREFEFPRRVEHALDTNQHVFLRMVEPVTRSTSTNDALKLQEGGDQQIYRGDKKKIVLGLF